VTEPPANRAIITVVVMAAAITQVVDTTIVAVALPHMQGSLSASPDEIAWVLTSYLIASGIFMPLTGYFTDRMGQRNFLMIGIAGFMIASALCGLATNLDEIVLFRLLQGIMGAGLVPQAQAILVQSYPPEERGRAMAIFGLGVVVGPILGPTLGGYLTQVLSWRWTFYINVPIGLFAFIGALIFVPDSERRERRMDWTGFAWLVMAVGTLQFILDRGTRYDWFSSDVIRICAVTSGVGFVLLLRHTWRHGRKAVFDLHVFRDRNFGFATLIFSVFMFSMYGMITLRPMLIETLLGYPALTTGLIMAPRGLASMAGMFLVSRLINRTGPRPLVIAGAATFTVGVLAMTRYSLQVDTWWLVWPTIVQGFGVGLAFVPLATVAFTTLPESDAHEAAGVRQLCRTIGGSVGVAVGAALFARQGQVSWNQLGAHINPYNPAVADTLARLGLEGITHRAGALFASILHQQAALQAMINVFLVLGVSVLATLPLLLLMGRVRRSETLT